MDIWEYTKIIWLVILLRWKNATDYFYETDEVAGVTLPQRHAMTGWAWNLFDTAGIYLRVLWKRWHRRGAPMP